MNKLLLLFIFLSSMKIYSQLVINSSGDYNLGVNVSGSTGILINTSNVNLDLNQQTVSSSNIGIEIGTGLSNISIRNGTITNCVTGLVINQNCSNIQVEDLIIQNCTSQAINITGSSGNLVQRCSLNKIQISGCSTLIAQLSCININFTTNIRLNKVSLVSNGTIATTQLNGITVQNSQQCVLNKIEMRNNQAIDLWGIVCGLATDSCMMRSCLLMDNLANAVMVGIYCTTSSSTNHIISKCIVSNNQSNGDDTGSLSPFESTTPFRIEDAFRIFCIDCIANNTMAIGTNFNNNAYGFLFDRAMQCGAINCQAVENISGNADGVGFAIGSTSSVSGVDQSFFMNNVAFGNMGSTSGNSYGFLATGAGNSDNTYINNKGIRNGTTAGNQVTTGTGGVPTGSVTTRTLTNLNSALTTNLTNIQVT